MSDDADTPVARPCLNPENLGLAEAVNRNRYAVEGIAARLGDLERTIRLATNKYGPEVKEGLARIAEDGAAEMKRSAQDYREAS